MYIKLRIYDPIGGRLSDTLAFPGQDVKDISVVVIDDHTVIAEMFVYSFFIRQMVVQFDTIASGIRSYDRWQPTQFDISAHIDTTSPVVVPGAEHLTITELTLDEGELTLVYRGTDDSLYGWGWEGLGLMKPDGEVILSHFGAIMPVGFRGQLNRFPIGDMDLSDLTLVWYGVAADHTMVGNWEFAVSDDNILGEQMFEGEFEGHRTVVVLGGTSLEIRIYEPQESLLYALQNETLENLAINVLLSDGTTIYALPDMSNVWSERRARISYVTSFVHPDDVVSVTFLGAVFDR